MRKRYVSYATITRETVAGLKGWDAVQARGIFARYAKVQQVDFCRPEQNNSQSRYEPPNRATAVYIKSTGGAHGKSARLRIPNYPGEVEVTNDVA